MQKMHAFTASHHKRGHPGGESEWTYRPVCSPCTLHTTRLHADHSFSVTTSSSGFCNAEKKLVGWADTIQNVSASSAGCLCVLCGAPSAITLQLASGGLPVHVSAYTYPGYAEEAAAAFAQASHGAALETPIKVIEGDNGVIEVGSAWTKMTRKNCLLCCSDLTCGVCDVNEVVLFKTSQIAYLRSSLESFTPSFIACCLSLVCIQNEPRRLRGIPGCSILYCCPPVLGWAMWFCLWISEVLACCSQFFCRRSHIVFGGSGVNSDISFPVAFTPEVQLREYVSDCMAPSPGVRFDPNLSACHPALSPDRYAAIIKAANESTGAAKMSLRESAV